MISLRLVVAALVGWLFPGLLAAAVLPQGGGISGMLVPKQVYVGTIGVPNGGPQGDRQLALVGDLNGDGRSEVAYSLYCGSNYAGAAVEILDGATGNSIATKNYPGWTYVAGIQDIDGDAVDDIVIGACYVDPPGQSGAWGAVDILSGASLSATRIAQGTNSNARLGIRPQVVPDLSGDGLPDILVGSNHDTTAGGLGAVIMMNSVTGARIYANGGPSYFGSVIRSGKDVDGDMYPDHLATRGYNSPQSGYLRLYSGQGGQLLWEEARTEIRFGALMTFCSDVDGDAIPDVIAGGVTHLTCLSGASGLQIWQVPLPVNSNPGVPGASHLVDCEALFGYPAVAIGDTAAAAGDGQVVFFNPANGAIMEVLVGSIPAGGFGGAMVADKDWDGDGVLDLAITSVAYTNAGVSRARVDVFSVASPVSAAASPYGAGCGSPPLQMAPSAPPILGSIGTVTIANVPFPLGGVTVGFSDTLVAGLPLLPLSLAGYGMPGCSLLHSNDIFGFPVTQSVPGTFDFALPIPSNAALLNGHLYLQAYAGAPGYNAAQFIVSNGIDWVIGNQ